MTDHAWEVTTDQGPFPLSYSDAVVATFLRVNNMIKWKVTLQRLGNLSLYSWLCLALAG